MSIVLSQDGRFYSYPVPLAEAYRGAIPRNPLKLWLRSDMGITLGTDLEISNWSDQLSGVVNSFSQSTVSLRPYLKKAAINGHDSLCFNGRTSGVIKRLLEDVTRKINNIAVLHIFFVVKIVNAAVSANFGNQNSFFGNTSTTSGTIKHFSFRPDTSKFYYQSGSGGTLEATNSVDLNTWYIVEFQMRPSANGDSFIFINGVSQGQSAVSYNTSGSLYFQLGGARGVSETTAQGDFEIAEVIGFNQFLPDPLPVRKYLSLKYGIPLTFP